MNEDFIRKRITALRIKKGVSKYKMSTDMGHSKGYIQTITSGRSLISWPEFFYMCEYFGISPSQFFDETLENPERIQRAINGLETVDAACQKRPLNGLF